MAEPASHASSRVQTRSVALFKETVSAKVVQKWKVRIGVGRPTEGNSLISKGVLSRCAGSDRAPRLQSLQRFHLCISGLFRRSLGGRESATGLDSN